MASDDSAANDVLTSLQGAAFGRYFRELRTERGLTREEFSARSGLSVAAIEQIEKGQAPALDGLRRICVGLDTPMSALFETFEDRDAAAIQEISWLLRSRDRRLIAVAVQIVRDLVRGLEE